MKKNLYLYVIILFLGAFFIGWWIGSGGKEFNHAEDTQVVVETWTCSMHPNISLPEFGQCPICFMDLIPQGGGFSTGEVTLKMSEAASKLAEISVSRIKRAPAFIELRLTGQLEYDEQRVRKITSWIDGRIERLYADYTGIRVNNNDHLLDIYSPSLVAAQEEFIQALGRFQNIGKDSGEMARRSAENSLNASRKKLRLLGVSEHQINQLERDGVPSTILTVYAPISGNVIKKNIHEGQYVKTGSLLYEIADISQLWLMMSVFESDINSLQIHQTVEFTTEAFPGEVFTGKIVFIQPFLDERKRTIQIRMNVPNPDEKLKPGMFVSATVKSKVDGNGKIIRNQLSGQWICPMHLEEISHNSGECSICQMPMVHAEDIPGLVSNPVSRNPLLVPVTAVMRTGVRSIVYLKNSMGDIAEYEGREITIGPRVGKNYVVLNGLKEGDVVVSQGAFKIDSALQIEAKPSMMNPGKSEKNIMSKNLNHDYHKKSDLSARQLNDILNNYLNIQTALADDEFSNGLKVYEQIIDQCRNGKYPESLCADIIEDQSAELKNISNLRIEFQQLSDFLQGLVTSQSINSEINLVYCPMAFDNTGAYWFQRGEDVRNPYFGHRMLKCGTIKERIR